MEKIEDPQAIERNKKIGKGCAVALGAVVLLSLSIGYCSPVPTPEEEAEDEAELDEQRAVAVQGWVNRMQAIPARCDVATAALGDQMQALGSGSGDRYAAYRAASTAQEQCGVAWLTFGETDPPAGLEGETEDLAEEAIESCKMAYYSKTEVAEVAAEIFDGDMRPSKMAALEDEAEAGSSGAARCAAQMMKVAIDVGLVVAEDGTVGLPEPATQRGAGEPE